MSTERSGLSKSLLAGIRKEPLGFLALCVGLVALFATPLLERVMQQTDRRHFDLMITCNSDRNLNVYVNKNTTGIHYAMLGNNCILTNTDSHPISVVRIQTFRVSKLDNEIRVRRSDPPYRKIELPRTLGVGEAMLASLPNFIRVPFGNVESGCNVNPRTDIFGSIGLDAFCTSPEASRAYEAFLDKGEPVDGHHRGVTIATGYIITLGDGRHEHIIQSSTEQSEAVVRALREKSI